jgi:hypothetical protein
MNQEGEGFGNFVAGLFGLVIGVPFALALLLVTYGVAVIVLRTAFGIELPNPVHWLPESWQSHIPGPY